MRTIRLAAALAAGVLFATGTVPATAQSTDPDSDPVGTTTNRLSLLGIDAGDLLSIDLLTDFARANTDPGVGERQAVAHLLPYSIVSPALGVSEERAVTSVQSSGEPDSTHEEYSVVDNPVLSGTLIPSDGSAAVDASGAVAGLLAGLDDLDVLGGLVAIDNASLLLGSKARTAQSDGLHAVQLEGIRVLDLGTLLAGIGLPLDGLPLDTVLALVDGLGLLDELGATLEALGLPGLDLSNLSVASILGAVDDLTADVGELTDLAADLAASVPVCDVSQPVFDLLGNLIGQAPSGLCDDVAATTTATTQALATLTGLLGEVLGAPLAVLADAPLLAIDGVSVAVTTKATDSADTSVADVAVDLGAITVGDLTVPALGAVPALDAVTAAIGQAQGAMAGILGAIDPSLADLVTVRALEETTGVSDDDGVITASADFVGLEIQVSPDLEEILAVLSGFASTTSIGDRLGALGLPVPALPAIVGFNELLAGTPTSGLFDSDAVYALSEGLTVRVAGVSQSSVYAVAGSTATPPTADLPRTGQEQATLLLLGGLAIAAFLGLRRLRA